ncbi:MAG: hypothetical protein HQK55_01775 [Deltaproteobacteria bacterium]|nr:hypothetical protein [Deltaproteobacteria bacterium]
MKCFFCSKPLDIEGKVSFRELCPHCGMDVHVCRNCEFYDPGRASYCREPGAEKVRDVEARNTCEYFVLSRKASGPADELAKAKEALENLFKKK